MPYTPPSSTLFASAQRPGLGNFGGSHGRHKSEPTLIAPGRRQKTSTTASSSYLYRHRRSISRNLTAPNGYISHTPDPTSTIRLGPNDSPNYHTAGLESSSPVANTSLMAVRGVISPPDSRRNSSDDEASTANKNKEKEELIFAELQAAIMSIEPQCSNPPLEGTIVEGSARSDGRPDPSLSMLDVPSRIDLKQESRDASLSLMRSCGLEGAIFDPQQIEAATQTPDDSDGEDNLELIAKPQMVRKKSGELVRPALRAGARKRPSSMPGTPTFAKAVHFDAQLEHIRHFLQVDKPLAVSAGSSPVENYDGDSEFPFGMDESSNLPSSFEWEAHVVNFPPESEARKRLPVRLDRIFLSPDNEYLVGLVAVANLAFSKHVAARFTFDYWKTTSEVTAEFNDDVRRQYPNDGYDRFRFSIRLADQADLETKRMFICIRYNVSSMEFWDNNNFMNYHVDFSKKHKPRDPRPPALPASASQPLRQLPRSRHSSNLPPRPRSMPALDMLSNVAADDNRQDGGRSSIRRSGRGSDDVPEAPQPRRKPATQAFGNRYDFGASLSAAMQSSIAGQTRRGLSSEDIGGPVSMARLGGLANNDKVISKIGASRSLGDMAPVTEQGAAAAVPLYGVRPEDLSTDKPYHQSPVYQELVDKYCFFGTATTASFQKNRFSRHSHNSSRGAMSTATVNDASAESSAMSSPAASHTMECPVPIRAPNNPPSPSRSSDRSSPDFGSHSSSPVSFAYPYQQNALLRESPTPPAIST